MTKLILPFSFLLMSFITNAQLKGSGNTISKTFENIDFDKVYFEDLDGKIEVEIGKSYSILVVVDDNIEPLLSVTQNGNSITVKFQNNKNNWRYIESTNTKIKITLPQASFISNKGNSDLQIKNCNGNYLKLENLSNGNVNITGNIENLEIVNKSNGNLNAKGLIAKNASIICKGNGTVAVNVSDKITAIARGNGNVKNIGLAKFDNKSSKSGNGNLINN
jgi:hypothetical protein